MIVASTYPLFNRTQAGSGRGAEASQLQFGTTNAEGIYNALIALFPGMTARPLDYNDPDRGGNTPPVWISVVGANSIWPLRWYSTPPLPYLHKPVASETPRSAPRVQASRTFTLAAFVLSLVVAGHVLGYSLRNRKWVMARQAESVFLGVFAGAGLRRRLPYLLVAYVSLVLYYGFFAYLFASIALHGDIRARVIAPPMVALALALSGCALHIGWQCVDGIRDRIRHSTRVTAIDPQYWIITIAAACSAAAILLGGQYLWQLTDPASIMTVL
jgi:hypothetical protein